jgi:uncharacterized protein (DUF427 family)
MSSVALPNESVWDYPRPPRLEEDRRLVVVRRGGLLIAETTRSIRVLETSHPPVFYIDPADVATDMLAPAPSATFCEFKGRAVYWDLKGETPLSEVGWSYPDPQPGFERIANWLAFYPSKLECRVDGEAVLSQAGGFYGGWITGEIVGPFKGGPGTWGW